MKHIVFDFGGVLMKHDREGCLHDLRQFLSDEDITNVLGFGNDQDDTLRARFEVGASDTRYFIEHALRLCKPGTTEQQLIDAWNKIRAGIPDETWQTIKDLRAQGYRTYLMSNTDEIHWQHTLSLYRQQIESLFDDVFLSFELGHAKPAEAFFRYVANVLNDGQTIFVDDMEINRLAAQQFVGWQTCASIDELKHKLYILTDFIS
jgi:putative hydrolase of the HAD superfamily